MFHSLPMRVPARDATVFVAASLFTIGDVQFTGNALKQDNVDKGRPGFLTSGIIGRLSLTDTNRPVGKPLARKW